MSGMTTTGTIKTSDYDGRIVEIKATGVCRQDVMRTSDYTVKGSHSNMVQEMRKIHRLGGKVTGVTVLQ